MVGVVPAGEQYRTHVCIDAAALACRATGRELPPAVAWRGVGQVLVEVGSAEEAEALCAAAIAAEERCV